MLCKGINRKSEPKINEEAKQLSLVRQEKIPQSSQIIHELGIKRETIGLYHKDSPMPKCVYKCICVCACACLSIFIYI